MTTTFIYVDFKTRKVVTSTSFPGNVLEPSLYEGFLPRGTKAARLFKEGYKYVGYFEGWKLYMLSKYSILNIHP